MDFFDYIFSAEIFGFIITLFTLFITWCVIVIIINDLHTSSNYIFSGAVFSNFLNSSMVILCNRGYR